MKDILIYSTAACPYCIVAKRALEKAGIGYREIDITRTPHVRDELHAKTGERTVPQVFVDGVYIGQDDELVAMIDSGELSADGDDTTDDDDEDQRSRYDVAIIGGGRGGLTLARNLPKSVSIAIFDRSPHVDGLRPDRDVLRNGLSDHNITYIEREVFGLEPGDGQHTLITLDGPITARAVVVASGARGRLPNIDGEQDLAGKGVSYCAECDSAFFNGLTVAVAGHDQRATKAALHLADTAQHVHLLNPHRELFADRSALSALASKANVTVHHHVRIQAIQGDTQVTGVVLDNGTELAVAGVFIYLYGSLPDTGFLKGLVQLTEQGAVDVSGPGAASRAGIYAVGPVASVGGDTPPYPALAQAILTPLGVEA